MCSGHKTLTFSPLKPGIHELQSAVYSVHCEWPRGQRESGIRGNLILLRSGSFRLA